MIFNSIEFFLFLPIVYLIYCRLSHRRQNIFLLAASYFFYGWWDIRFLYLITLSTSVDYCAGILIDKGKISSRHLLPAIGYVVLSGISFLGIGSYMLGQNLLQSLWMTAAGVGASFSFFLLVLLLERKALGLSMERKRKIYLASSVIVNLGILAAFKYFNFFVDSAQTVLAGMGFPDVSLTTLNVILPVGISFYTFQTLSYSIDIYRRKLKSTENYLDFALFVSYFPQLVAGPIERASHLLPAIQSPRTLKLQQTLDGICLISYGMFKKVVIADGLAGAVDAVYGTSGAVSSVDIAIATLFFALQIYCDFSGYSDIARGASKMLGIELMLNFRLPYFSRSPSEFWQRWHISLSSWLRDYLYIPLGGNRGGTVATYRNLMTTMLLGGLWHGAAWNFVLWGGYHGFLLCLYRAIPESFQSWWSGSRTRAALGFWLSMALFFVFTLYGWLLFRAVSFEQIATFTSSLLQLKGLGDPLTVPIPPFSALLGLPILMGYELASYAAEKGWHPPAPVQVLRPALYGLMLFAFIASLSTPPAQFIYFQF
jgi:alginate O-acetyltransferase complex protein AlgI